ncbi:MAG: hypothetical protein JWM11_405 [Planctomycetaceae bacterium]|nr:hypothetical protein [Planctomycetaceae bacterium]
MKRRFLILTGTLAALILVVSTAQQAEAVWGNQSAAYGGKSGTAYGYTNGFGWNSAAVEGLQPPCIRRAWGNFRGTNVNCGPAYGNYCVPAAACNGVYSRVNGHP